MCPHEKVVGTEAGPVCTQCGQILTEADAVERLPNPLIESNLNIAPLMKRLDRIEEKHCPDAGWPRELDLFDIPEDYE